MQGAEEVRATPNIAKIATGVQSDLVITPALTKYLMQEPGPYYSEIVADLIKDQLLGEERIRYGSFSASSISLHCFRAGVFQFLGAKQNEGSDSLRNAVLSNLFLDGHWRHLRLQAVCLEIGVIDTIEFLMVDENLKLIGTADGISFEHNYGVEFKGAHERQFQIIRRMKRPVEHHYWQVHAYMLLTGMKTWYIVYEDKNSSDWKEYKITRDERVIDQIKGYLRSCHTILNTEQLPPMLEPCTSKEGPYKGCNYRDICERCGTWPQDKDVSVSREALVQIRPKRRTGGRVNLDRPSVSSESITEVFPSTS